MRKYLLSAVALSALVAAGTSAHADMAAAEARIPCLSPLRTFVADMPVTSAERLIELRSI